MSSKPSRPARPARRGAPASGKRERNKAQNRADILTAAREVFTELGFEGATVRDIIRRTRLASGTFYNYFPDKESVFRALLQDSEARRLRSLAEVGRGDGGYEEALRRSFRAYFDFVISDRTTFDLLRRNAHVVRGLAKEAVLVDEHARMRRQIVADIEHGAIPPVDVDFLASAIVGVAFEVAVVMVEREPPDVEAATDFVTNLFLGLYARERRAERAGSGSQRRRLAVRA